MVILDMVPEEKLWPISGCTCSHLDHSIWMRDQENMPPPSMHIIDSKLAQVHLLEFIKKNTLLPYEQACHHLMNVLQAFDKCHRSDRCLNWMKMKPGWFFCKKVCQTQLA
jgi:hypothetical protein